MLLRKVVYPHEFINDWERLPEKEEFYSNLYKEDITDANYMHAKRVCEEFEIKILGEYGDLYYKSHTLLSANLFENIRKMRLEFIILILENFF